jgi:GT2 family glycosyltransferase
MLIKREVFEGIGYFDERYFLYFEDVDFCLRAKRANFQISVEPKSIITHQLIEGKNKPFSRQLQLIKSNFIFINKYLNWRIPLGYLYLLALTGKIIIKYRFLHLKGVPPQLRRCWRATFQVF